METLKNFDMIAGNVNFINYLKEAYMLHVGLSVQWKCADLKVFGKSLEYVCIFGINKRRLWNILNIRTTEKLSIILKLFKNANELYIRLCGNNQFYHNRSFPGENVSLSINFGNNKYSSLIVLDVHPFANKYFFSQKLLYN